MKIGAPAPSHAELTGVGTDDHHARDHAATHAVGGADVLPATTVGVQTLDIDPTDVTVVNTAAETALYTFTVAADTLGTLDVLHLIAEGTILNNTGANRTSILRARLGGIAGALVFDHPAINYATGAARRNWLLEAWIAAQAATNAQLTWGRVMLSPAGGNGFDYEQQDRQTPARDMTVAQDVVVSVQHSVANASLDAIVETVVLELVRGI